MAEQDNQLVGYLAAQAERLNVTEHSAYLVIGILQAFADQGMAHIVPKNGRMGQTKNIHRLELTVMTHNTAGIALYKKQGFAIEGTRRHSLLINGQFVDEFYYVKIVGSTSVKYLNTYFTTDFSRNLT